MSGGRNGRGRVVDIGSKNIQIGKDPIKSKDFKINLGESKLPFIWLFLKEC